MKQMIETISRQYDEAYYKGQALFDKYNPCQHVVHPCGGLTCVAKHTPGPLCCPDCEYHSDTGCTVMCLGCKLNLCYSAGVHHEFRGKLWTILRSLPLDDHRLLRIRRPKEEIMEQVALNIGRMLR